MSLTQEQEAFSNRIKNTSNTVRKQFYEGNESLLAEIEIKMVQAKTLTEK